MGKRTGNVPLKDSTETKMGCQERRGGRDGQLVRSSMDRTWTVVGVGGSPKLDPPEPQESLVRMGFQLSTVRRFLRRVALGEHSTMKVASCVRGELLSIVGLMVESVGDREAVVYPAADAKQPECCTLDCESPVAESITSLRLDPSSMGQSESRVNQQGPLGGEMPLNPELAGSPRNAPEAQQLTGISGRGKALFRCGPRERVPPQGSSTEGESGPKIRPKGVVDGQQALGLRSLGGRRRRPPSGGPEPSEIPLWKG
ncbi:hypothetical protein HAX54_025962 [Datura stramonium]|uniref:Uncharacterized protein n=1 Tax=Datura stramonium TaxID=4076 RepID=A0ABS8V338_DATST|nr:hypothetical protein [Datura stramonium]